MRILFIGDVVGPQRPQVLLERLGGLIRDWKLDFVAVNGENAAGGFGITEAIYHEFVDAGADVITGGNHSWDQREALVFIERAPKLLRPINFPPGTPGPRRGADRRQERRARARGQRHGPRVHGCARRSVRRGRARARRLPRSSATPTRSSSTSIARRPARSRRMGHFCDGRASLVVGTHTHAPTADHQMLPGGTAFISDVGMTGDYNFDHRHAVKDEPLNRFLRKIPVSAVRAGGRRGDAVRRRGRDRRRHRPRAPHRRGAARRTAGGGKPAFWE